jgi:hypothetical protein
MASELTPIDIRRAPDFAALVEEVRTTRKPRRIFRDDEEVAILMPAARRTRRTGRPSDADLAAFRAAAGSWKDYLDPEEFAHDRRELQMDEQPPRKQ